MDPVVKQVLLVDDEASHNLLHRLLLERTGLPICVSTVEDAGEARRYLEQAEAGETPWPDLMCLDLNMPATNGWEFLDELAAWPIWKKHDTPVAVMTTSANPQEMAQAEAIPGVIAFMQKPMTVGGFQRLLASVRERLYGTEGGGI